MVIVAIEIIVAFGYLRNGALDHYLLHPLVALATTLPFLLLARALGWKVREELIICYGFVNFARFPDYLFVAGMDHQEWMNVFLLHLAFDDIIRPALLFLGAQVAVLGVAYGLLKRPAEFSRR